MKHMLKYKFSSHKVCGKLEQGDELDGFQKLVSDDHDNSITLGVW